MNKTFKLALSEINLDVLDKDLQKWKISFLNGAFSQLQKIKCQKLLDGNANIKDANKFALGNFLE